jgi:hypothetical protein
MLFDNMAAFPWKGLGFRHIYFLDGFVDLEKPNRSGKYHCEKYIAITIFLINGLETDFPYPIDFKGSLIFFCNFLVNTLGSR